MNVRALALLLSVVGCATTPRPRALTDVQQAREGAAVERAERLAPQAYLHAEKIYKSAVRAHDDGDAPAAQLLSEQALAAYSHAVVLARVAEGERRLFTSRSALGKSEKALAGIDEQQRQVAAEADDLEMRIKVARDALPLMPNEPASAERERARREAAHSLALQARLLCVSTKLLAPQLEGVDAELKAIDALDAELAGAPRATPIDAAVRLRSSCLSKLTAARRAASRKAPEAGKVDALLEALSRADMQPARDDRGVVVVLRDVFRGAQLRPDVKKRIDSLGQTARENPDFPVLVVVHSARGGASAADRQRAASLADALRAAGATKVEAQAAGDAHPVVPKDRPGATQRNERVELVFVAPMY